MQGWMQMKMKMKMQRKGWMPMPRFTGMVVRMQLDWQMPVKGWMPMKLHMQRRTDVEMVVQVQLERFMGMHMHVQTRMGMQRDRKCVCEGMEGRTGSGRMEGSDEGVRVPMCGLHPCDGLNLAGQAGA